MTSRIGDTSLAGSEKPAADPVKVLSKKKIQERFAPIGQKFDKLVDKTVKYGTASSGALLAHTMLTKATPYVLGDSYKGFFSTRAACLELGVMSLTSTIYNFFMALGSTVLAAVTLGQFSSLNKSFTTNWLHTSIAAFSTFEGVLGFVSPTASLGLAKVAARKTCESFASDIRAIRKEYTTAKLSSEELTKEFMSHLKSHLQNWGEAGAKIGLYITPDILEFARNNTISILKDEQASERKDAVKTRDKAVKDAKKAEKTALKAAGKLDKASKKEAIKKAKEECKEAIKTANKELKAFDKKQGNGVDNANIFFNSLSKAVKEEFTIEKLEEIISGAIDKFIAPKDERADRKKELGKLVGGLLDRTYASANQNAKEAELDRAKANPDKLKKAERKVAVTDAKEASKTATKERKLIAMNSNLEELAVRSAKINAKIEELTTQRTDEKAKSKKKRDTNLIDSLKIQIKALKKEAKTIEKKGDKLGKKVEAFIAKEAALGTADSITARNEKEVVKTAVGMTKVALGEKLTEKRAQTALKLANLVVDKRTITAVGNAVKEIFKEDASEETEGSEELDGPEELSYDDLFEVPEPVVTFSGLDGAEGTFSIGDETGFLAGSDGFFYKVGPDGQKQKTDRKISAEHMGNRFFRPVLGRAREMHV